MYTLLIRDPNGETETLYGLDSVGVLARANTLRLDIPTWQFARLLTGESVDRGGYRLQVRSERNDSIALDRISEALTSAATTGEVVQRVTQLVEWVRPGYADLSDTLTPEQDDYDPERGNPALSELSEAQQARIREVADRINPA